MTYTNIAPPREVFMIPLWVTLSPNEMEVVEFAYETSKAAHKEQVRDDGTRYFDHPKAVTWNYIDGFGGRDPRQICGLLLHDTVEDSFLMTPRRLMINFGADIALDVMAMTKLTRVKEPTEEYLERVIKQGQYAIAGKLFDRLHNTRTLADVKAEKRASQIKETEDYHLKMLVPALEDCGEESAKMAAWLREKILKAITQYKD